MFYNFNIEALDDKFCVLAVMKCDLQPSDKTFTFEGNLQFESKYKLFMYKSNLIKSNGYMRIESSLYKIMDIKNWDDYMEVWLHECKRNI